MSEDALQQAAAELISHSGLSGEMVMQALPGGANNQVYRVVVENKVFLLKAYFQHPDDVRDRLTAEFEFSQFAWGHGVCCLPQPIARAEQNRLALYSFVEGRPVLAQQVTEQLVRQALDFYCALNREKNRPDAKSLPLASEACFSLSQHIQCVEQRVTRLQNMDRASTFDDEAAQFIDGELLDAWGRVKEMTLGRARQLHVVVDEEIDLADRCISPSDFGFHNAILTNDGSLCFIDFEYAGWDDPAKMVCDVFCQPALPVPAEQWDPFVDVVVAELAESDLHRQRIALLRPVYQIKWCCILLNDFLPVGDQRRRFARYGVDREDQKKKQLDKARLGLKQVIV